MWFFYWISFYLIFLKKQQKMFSFMESYLLLKKNGEGKRYDPWKNSEKQKNAKKKRLLISAATWIVFLA